MTTGDHQPPAPAEPFPARGGDILLSVVLPIYNEAPVLPRLLSALRQALEQAACRTEIIAVNDGSVDQTRGLLDELAAQDANLRVLHLSRNFGHQAAVQAGLAHAAGDAIVIMDADLQDDPATIPRLVARWRAGDDVVYAIRVRRKESAAKRFLFFGFYRLLNAVSRTPMPKDAGNFGLIDRRVAAVILRLAEHDRYYPGLRRWVGFRQVGVEVERHARYDGKPKVSLLGLARLAKTAIFSFSTLPLSVFYLIAFSALVVFTGLAAFTLYHKLITGAAIPGWTSELMVASFFGALNALGIAMLGEYVIRIYDQVRGRPLFVIEAKRNFASAASPTRTANDPQTAPGPH